MGGNITGGNFLGGNFPGGIFQGGLWWVRIFPGRIFLEPFWTFTIEKNWRSQNLSENRSSHQRCSIKKGTLTNFTKFTGKHLCQSLFLNKAAGLRPATSLKKRFWHRCFPVSFTKFLRIPFLQNTSGRLLLGKVNLSERKFEEMHEIWRAKRCKYIWENVYFGIIIFNCLSSTKQSLRFLLNCFVQEIKGFY